MWPDLIEHGVSVHERGQLHRGAQSVQPVDQEQGVPALRQPEDQHRQYLLQAEAVSQGHQDVPHGARSNTRHESGPQVSLGVLYRIAKIKQKRNEHLLQLQ